MKQEEILRLWENIFTSLNAGWYNWAISSSLREINNYPWSTIAAFYSIHSLAQVLVYLVQRLEEQDAILIAFVEEREKLSEFFLNLNSSAEQEELRNLLLARLSKKTGLSIQILDRKIRLLGEILRLDKDYQSLEEELQKKMQDEFWIKTNAKFLDNILKVNLIVTELIRFSIENCQPSERYVILIYLQEELKNLHKTLKKEKIKRVPYWDFDQFIEEFSQFIHSELIFLKEIELPRISNQQKELLVRKKNEETWKSLNQWSFS